MMEPENTINGDARGWTLPTAFGFIILPLRQMSIKSAHIAINTKAAKDIPREERIRA